MGTDREDRLLEELEDLEDIQAFDAAVESGDEAIPFEQAIEEIAAGLKRKEAFNGICDDGS